MTVFPPLHTEKMVSTLASEYPNTSVIKKMSDLTKSIASQDNDLQCSTTKSAFEPMKDEKSLSSTSNEKMETKECLNDVDTNHQVDMDTKPSHSYIALIAMAILSRPSKKVLLGDIYGYISEHFPYYRSKDKSWRNSIRHNLSLNECFIKAGRSENGKGNYWTIHPANLEDFSNGDFRRRRARRRVRKSHSTLCTRYGTFPFHSHSAYYRTSDPYIHPSYYLTPFNLPHCVRKIAVQESLTTSPSRLPPNLIEFTPQSAAICQSALLQVGRNTESSYYHSNPLSISSALHQAVVGSTSSTNIRDTPIESWQDTWRKLKAQFSHNQK